jgi:hypothetical protein
VLGDCEGFIHKEIEPALKKKGWQVAPSLYEAIDIGTTYTKFSLFIHLLKLFG